MPAMTMSRAAVRPVAQVQKPKVQAPKPQKVRMSVAAVASAACELSATVAKRHPVELRTALTYAATIAAFQR